MTGTAQKVDSLASYKVRGDKNADGEWTQHVRAVGDALVPEAYDYISMSYTGSDLTGVVYKSGGSSGTVIATLALAYNSGDLISVTRT